MGTIVEFAGSQPSSNSGGSTEETSGAALEPSAPRGYLSAPSGESGPGVLVVQEWWGLDSGIKEMADRLAAEGFVALAPDLYRGELAGHTEMDKAGELMNSMPFERAAADMSAAVDFLIANEAVTSDGIGVVGFCMGGMLSFYIAANRPDVVRAVVPFYGFPTGDGQPEYAHITAAIQGHMADHDDFFPPAAARELEHRLQALGLDATLTVHPGSGHAFMAPHNALGTQDTDLYQQIWPQVIAFLQTHLS